MAAYVAHHPPGSPGSDRRLAGHRPALPPRLAARPFDTRRRLPIPYVSEHDDGHVDFSLLNGTRVLDCVRRGLCSACGQPHEPQLAFVGGTSGFYRAATTTRRCIWNFLDNMAAEFPQLMTTSNSWRVQLWDECGGDCLG